MDVAWFLWMLVTFKVAVKKWVTRGNTILADRQAQWMYGFLKQQRKDTHFVSITVALERLYCRQAVINQNNHLYNISAKQNGHINNKKIVRRTLLKSCLHLMLNMSLSRVQAKPRNLLLGHTQMYNICELFLIIIWQCKRSDLQRYKVRVVDTDGTTCS